MESLADSVARLEQFYGGDLSFQLSDIEYKLKGRMPEDCVAMNGALGVNTDLIKSAAQVKRIAGQINVVVHAVGMMHLLPQLLEPGEKIEYLSLGAANTGKKFDLETDRRIAEFKFIAWRGGAEVIRQNSIFKDFFYLAEHPGPKARFLYLLDEKYPLKFLRSGRGIGNVLKRMHAVEAEFRELYGDQFATVGDYYELHAERVRIVNVAPMLPKELLMAEVVAAESEGEGFSEPA